MDPMEILPPEICLRILESMAVEDLCHCLAVSHRWRELADSDYLWKPFCHIKPLQVNHHISPPKGDRVVNDVLGPLPLCRNASDYVGYMTRLVENWCTGTYESHQLSKEDWCCCIASSGNVIAIYYPRPSNVQVYTIKKDLIPVCTISVALPNGIAIPDVFINEHFIVLSRGNVVLIYKNNGEYSLYKAIVGDEFGLSVADNIVPFVENDRRLYVKVISEDTIWMESDTVYVVDMLTNRYKVLPDKFRCLRFDGKHVYAANSVVSKYDLKGNKVFSLDIHQVEDMWVSDEIVVVVIAGECQHLEVWHLGSKSLMCRFQIEKDPCVSIGPDSSQIFVLELKDDLYKVSCIGSKTGAALWSYQNTFQREHVIHPELRLVCDRFVFARPSHTKDENFLLLDCKSGKVLYDCVMPPCLSPPCYIYHLSDELFITAESNSIHIRTYL